MSNALASLFFVVGMMVLGWSHVAAETTDARAQPTALVEQLQSTYQQLHSLQFNFAQVTDSNGRIKEGNGHAVFYRTGTTASARAGIMRWDYVEPIPQVILNNGRELSIYTPQDKQLIVTRAPDLESDITYAIFIGTKKLTDEFNPDLPDPVFLLNDPPKGLQAVLLTPRQPHTQIKRVQLWMDKQHMLHRLLMEDHFGALSELTFTQVRFNVLPPGDGKQEQMLLHLDLVPGTEVIHQ